MIRGGRAIPRETVGPPRFFAPRDRFLIDAAAIRNDLKSFGVITDMRSNRQKSMPTAKQRRNPGTSASRWGWLTI
jgi:hypothetical protein